MTTLHEVTIYRDDSTTKVVYENRQALLLDGRQHGFDLGYFA